MIKSKCKICTICGRDDQPWFSKKRCKSCAQKSYNKPKKKNEQSVAAKKKTAKREQLNEYFRRIEDSYVGPQRCQESGNTIIKVSRVNISHIFPKRTYESVMCSEDNYMLYSLQSHTDFDNLLDRLDFPGLEIKFPNSWPIVCLKVRKMLSSGEVTEHGKLRSAFEEYLNLND